LSQHIRMLACTRLADCYAGRVESPVIEAAPGAQPGSGFYF
jgi:hypothetical protein